MKTPRARRRHSLSQLGTAPLESALLIGAVALVGAASFAAIGGGYDSAIASGSDAREAAAPHATAAPGPAAQAGLASLAGAAEDLARPVVSGLAKADLRRSPIGRALQLSDDPAWRDATTMFFHDRIQRGRPFGEPILRPFEKFLGSTEGRNADRIVPEVRQALRAAEAKGPLEATGAYVTDERLSKLVEDPVLDVLAKYGGHVRRSDAASGLPFAFEGRDLVLFENHPAFARTGGSTSPLVDQIYERYALHLLEISGAPPESASALSALLRATERQRTSANRRIDLYHAWKKADASLTEARGRVGHLHAEIEKFLLEPRRVAEEHLVKLAVRLEEARSGLPARERRLAGIDRGLEGLSARVAERTAETGLAERRFEQTRLGVGEHGAAADLDTRMRLAAEEADAFRAEVGLPSTRNGEPVLKTRAKRADAPKREPSEAARRADAFLSELGAD